MRSAMPTQLSSVPLTAVRARCGWAFHAFRYANSVVIRSAISGQSALWVGASCVPLCQVSFVTRSANSGQAHCGWACHAFRYAKSVLSRDPLTAARAHGGWARHAFRYAKSVLSRDPLTAARALCGWARHAFCYANSVVIRSAISGQGPWWVGVSRVPLCQVSFVTRSANSGQALCGWARHAFRYANSVVIRSAISGQGPWWVGVSRVPLTAARAHGGWACHAFR